MSARAKPAEIKKLQGTTNKSREPNNPVKPDYGTPQCPEFLSDEARRAWDSIAPMLTRMNVLALSDSVGLMLLSDALAEYIDITKSVNEMDMDQKFYESDSRHGETVVKMRPELRRKKELLDSILKIIDRYGMTPSARAKLEAPPPPGEGDEFEVFLGQLEAKP